VEKKFINARIKELRKSLKLNQTEFGARIGLKTSAMSKMEQEGSPITEQSITLICEKFNVRRDWLTEGTGEMLQETEDTLFASFVERYHLSPDDQILARYLLQLTSEERQMVIRHIMEVSELLRKGRAMAAMHDQGLSLEEQEAAEIAAVREKYRAMKDDGTAPANVSNSDTPAPAEVLNPEIERKAGQYRAKLYAQDKTRQILSGSDNTATTSTNEKSRP